MSATGWVKTPEQIRRIQERLAAPAFLQGKMLSVSFLTRPEIVREVLPPPLEPTSQPLVTVSVCTFGTSNCVGEFAGGIVGVAARYQGIEGNHCLAMPMSTDVAIIFGREHQKKARDQARAGRKSNCLQRRADGVGSGIGGAANGGVGITGCDAEGREVERLAREFASFLLG